MVPGARQSPMRWIAIRSTSCLVEVILGLAGRRHHDVRRLDLVEFARCRWTRGSPSLPLTLASEVPVSRAMPSPRILAWIRCCSSVCVVQVETSLAGVTSVTSSPARRNASAMTPPM